mmetsp:Transcript_13777/g.24194  ORF Transcript_13777/g.24194 Transcript_13777/m.24194 type:complete len:273 (-) Transcript_13777:3801-4619(-)
MQFPIERSALAGGGRSLAGRGPICQRHGVFHYSVEMCGPESFGAEKLVGVGPHLAMLLLLLFLVLMVLTAFFVTAVIVVMFVLILMFFGAVKTMVLLSILVLRLSSTVQKALIIQWRVATVPAHVVTLALVIIAIIAILVRRAAVHVLVLNTWGDICVDLHGIGHALFFFIVRLVWRLMAFVVMRTVTQALIGSQDAVVQHVPHLCVQGAHRTAAVAAAAGTFDVVRYRRTVGATRRFQRLLSRDRAFRGRCDSGDKRTRLLHCGGNNSTGS